MPYLGLNRKFFHLVVRISPPPVVEGVGPRAGMRGRPLREFELAAVFELMFFHSGIL